MKINSQNIIANIILVCILTFIVTTHFAIFFIFMFMPIPSMAHFITYPLLLLFPEYFVLFVTILKYNKYGLHS